MKKVAVRLPVSARDVARRAGVSQPTVSRALSGGRVTPETQDKVLRAARELGYRPNMAGRLLQGRRALRIAVVVTHGEEAVGGVLDELADCLNAAGLQLEIVHSARGDAERIAGELAEGGFDRVIVDQRVA